MIASDYYYSARTAILQRYFGIYRCCLRRDVNYIYFDGAKSGQPRRLLVFTLLSEAFIIYGEDMRYIYSLMAFERFDLIYFMFTIW